MEKLKSLYVHYLHVPFASDDFEVGRYKVKSITEYQGYFEITFIDSPQTKVINKAKVVYWTKIREADANN
jgi:hypothetical protein